MTKLSAQALLDVWEAEQRSNRLPGDAILERLLDCDGGTLARLPLGRRAAGLLRVHALLFGNALPARTACPHCSAELESLLPIDALLAEAASRLDFADELDVVTSGLVVRCRPPRAADLIGLTKLDAPEALQLLVQRCVIDVRAESESVATSPLPAALITAMANAMAAADPCGELLLDLTCPACEHVWQAVLEPTEFVLAELNAHARRLLGEVDVLARVYGWTEASILALSPLRRQAYLELALA